MTSGLRGSDIIHKIVESMKYHGLEVVVYDTVESNPKDYNVMDAVSTYQQNACATVPGAGHGHGHGHNGAHSAADTHDADGRDGPRVRAAKDRAGRHGEGVDGNPLRLGRPADGDGTGRRCTPSPRARAASRSSRAASVRRDRRAIRESLLRRRSTKAAGSP